ncbi:nuclear transport factor 2 family protein [Achromobacter xylosoxidans]|uniref:nuclear transport factor 2 family protein n=1 Tax=Alcaligenes xylosoxydans xylosoxydans TaxID=85698 RepID=UPI0022B8CEAE|nr:nuclear transport factor 2 family protein [Achromobacter xylosoxidans]MCZ8388821.1 nuclear transport factor 2 family protein [Achromobacter xylosoxidans]
MSDTLSLCHNQVMAFFRDLDESRYDDLVRRLAPDSVWLRQGKTLAGRDATLRALSLRSATQRIHHLICNLAAHAWSADRCALRGYMLVVRHDSGSPLSGPAPLAGVDTIRTLRVELARIDGEWLIARMANDEPSFSAQAA